MSIYDGLVICHPKEHCSTWDFCTHYIPHMKGDACSCDSCVPCDTRTLLQHRVKMKEANIAARDKWWIERVEQMLRFNKSQERVLGSISEVVLYELWQQLKKELEEK